MPRKSRASIDEEVTILDSQIRKLSAREDDLQRAMDDLSRIKDDVASERTTLAERRKDLQLQKHPINWLPPELLIHIFSALVDVDLDDVRYRPPVVLSHVCARWRTAVMSSPHLWSRITLQGFASGEIARTFLARSKGAPLEINYSSLPDSMPTEECTHTVHFISMVCVHFSRCLDFSFRSNTPKPITYLLPFLNDFAKVFPQLRRLNLSIASPNPIYLEALVLLEREEAMRGRRPATPPPHGATNLRHLSIGQIPLSNFTTTSIAHLRKLELTYPPRKHQLSRHSHDLKLSSLWGFLSLTPLLEELILNNAVPCLDALPVPPSQTTPNNPTMSYLPNVKLDHLKSIEWTYPSAVDVLRFLCLLDAPALDKLDLWVEHPPFKREAEWRLNGSPLHEFVQTRNVPCFPSLRDLSIQCNGGDDMVCALRKFSLPALEKLAFTNVDSAARGGYRCDGTNAPPPHEEVPPPLLVFPRLESVFHDPRLPHLTHVTLSHFKISPESGRGEALLGYMPLLTSLSLDSCMGVEILLSALQERLVVGLNRHHHHHPHLGTAAAGGAAVGANGSCPRRGVKLCPRLEALSIRGCQDVPFDCLRRVVFVRNGIVEEGSLQDGGGGSTGSAIASAPAPNGENNAPVTGRRVRADDDDDEEEEEGNPLEGRHTGHDDVVVVVANNAQGSNNNNNNSNTTVQAARRIKPLKLRHAGLSSTLLSSSSSSSSSPSCSSLSSSLSPSSSSNRTATMVSTLVAMREVLEPASIVYVRIADCKLVSREHAMSLRDLGVVDVIWAGSV